MGIDYQAAIMVGLPQNEVDYNEDEHEDLYDFLEENGMEVCSPYYDGGDADGAIAGFVYKSTSSYDSLEFVYDNDEVEKLRKQFLKITGLEAQVYLSPWEY